MPEDTIPVPRSLLVDLHRATRTAIATTKANADAAIERLRALPITANSDDIAAELTELRTIQRKYEDARDQIYDLLTRA